MNNYNLMNKFLELIKSFTLENPSKEITYNFIYSQLVGFNVGLDAYQNVEHLCNEIYSNLQKIKNPKLNLVWDNKYFVKCFYGKTNGNEIKLYIPFDKSHLVDSATKLFSYMISEDIPNASKVASTIRNDNIVVRVNTLEDAEKVMAYANTNLNIGRLDVNPFLANNNSIGLAMDNNDSFNSRLCKLIEEFLNFCKANNQMDSFNIDSFGLFVDKEWFKLHASNLMNPSSASLDMEDIYGLLRKTTKPNFQIKDFYEFANYKLIDKYDNKRRRITNPAYYLEQAIRVTYSKYPGNIPGAIFNYFYDEVIGFTNDNYARGGLVKYVKKEQVVPLMQEYVESLGYVPPTDSYDLVKLYVKLLNLDRGVTEEFEIIKNAYISTANKYNRAQADGVLKNLLICNYTMNFTDRDGYRTLLEQKVLGKDIKKIMQRGLNLPTDNLGVIINEFINSIDLGIQR